MRAGRYHGRVRDLVMTSATRLTVAQFLDVGRLASSLTRVELIDTPLLSDAWARTLSSLGNLTSLTIDRPGTDSTEAGLLALCGLTGLTSLRIRGRDVVCTDAFIGAVSDIASLTTLELHVSPYATNEGVMSLTKLARLTKLHLRCYKHNFSKFVFRAEFLAGLQSLERVALSCDTGIEDTLFALSSLPVLKHMSVGYRTPVVWDPRELSARYRFHSSGNPSLPLLTVQQPREDKCW
jgi:hypothetical protein